MKKILLAALAVCSAYLADAQKVKWETGNIDVLKGQSSVATEIVYPNVLNVSGMPEQEFLDERRKTDNAEKPGAGDSFVKRWTTARESKYIKRFSEHFTKATKEKVNAGTGEAKYVIILTPQNIDLGKGRYFGTKPAYVDFDVVIAENANRNNIVARGRAEKVPGESKAPKGSQWIPGGAGTAIDAANRSQNFDATNRIAESFELLAVTLGKQLR